MFKRGFTLAACGALALLLAAAETCPAQVFFSGNRGGFWGPGIGYPIGPNYYQQYSHPYIYNAPPTGYSSYMQYGMTSPTPIYYGAASMYYNGAAYPSASYSTARIVAPPAGTGLVGDSNVSSVGYSSQNYPARSPDYNTVYPIAPPLSAVTDNTARVEVRLPADAQLWFDGRGTAQTGETRSFRTPRLEAGQDYVYDVRAEWDADGRPVDATRKVTVHAGDRVVVDLRSK